MISKNYCNLTNFNLYTLFILLFTLKNDIYAETNNSLASFNWIHSYMASTNIQEMKSWEYSKNIIAYFQSFPQISFEMFSFFTTVITPNYYLFNSYRCNYNNPELKADPYEIIEEMVSLIRTLGLKHVQVDLMSNLDYVREPRHYQLFQEYVTPLLIALSKYATIDAIRETDIDLLSLQGLYHNNTRHLIPGVVNTVVYV